MNKIEQTLTSMEVAEMIGREHKELLRSIRLYAKNMEKVAERTNALGKENENAVGESPLGSKEEYFRESSYKDANGQSRPCFDVTKKGCEFIAHKMNGIKGTEFTMRYIDRFHKMEESTARLSDDPMELLKLHYQALEQVDSKVDKATEDIKSVKAEIEELKNDLPLFLGEAEEISNAAKKKGVDVLGGKQSNAYKNKSLQHKVYTNIYANLKYNFNVSSYKTIKRGNKEKALEIVQNYQPPLFLKEQIEAENAQQSFDFEDEGLRYE